MRLVMGLPERPTRFALGRSHLPEQEGPVVKARLDRTAELTSIIQTVRLAPTSGCRRPAAQVTRSLAWARASKIASLCFSAEVMVQTGEFDGRLRDLHARQDG